jgi:hypothetical protein
MKHNDELSATTENMFVKRCRYWSPTLIFLAICASAYLYAMFSLISKIPDLVASALQKNTTPQHYDFDK